MRREFWKQTDYLHGFYTTGIFGLESLGIEALYQLFCILVTGDIGTPQDVGVVCGRVPEWNSI